VLKKCNTFLAQQNRKVLQIREWRPLSARTCLSIGDELLLFTDIQSVEKVALENDYGKTYIELKRKDGQYNLYLQAGENFFAALKEITDIINEGVGLQYEFMYRR